MNLNALQRGIVSRLESIPTEVSTLATAGLLERSRIQAGKAATNLLRSFRPGKPMIWDPWILPDGDGYRLFYLKGVEGHTPWWSVSNICSATSTDMQHWHDLGVILEPSPAHAWESGRICAGCTHKENGVYYLFYSAGGAAEPELKNEAIGLATSIDGIYWQRQTEHFPLLPAQSDRGYGRCNWTNHFHWRDPYLFKDPRSNRYYLFICASANTPGNFQGCIGLAVADSIDGHYELLPPVVSPTPDTAADWAYYHMERPQVFYRNGKYHLLFSCFRMYLNPRWIQKHNSQLITNSSLYWYVSDEITGLFQPVHPEKFIVTNSEKTGMYGTTLLPIPTNPNEFITYGWYHRLHALEVSPTFRAKWSDRELTLSRGSIDS